MLTGLESQGLGSRLGQLTPWESRLGAPPTGECLWIVSPYDVQNKSSSHDRYFYYLTNFESWKLMREVSMMKVIPRNVK